MNFKELVPLKSKDAIIFNSPIEEDNNILRIGNNKSLLDAILNNILPEESYYNTDDMIKMKYIESLKKTLMNEKVLEMSLEKNKDFIDQFKTNVYTIFYNFYEYMSALQGETKRTFDTHENLSFSEINKSIVKNLIKSDKDESEYELICEVLPLSSIYERMDSFFDQISNETIPSLKTCKKHIIVLLNEHVNNLEILKEIQSDKATYFQKILNTFIHQIINDSEFNVYKKIVMMIKNIDKNIDINLLKLLEEYFETDILFLNSVDRTPMKIYDNLKEPSNEYSVILLRFTNSSKDETDNLNLHKYENVCKLIKRNKIQRKFSNTDSLILNFYKMVDSDSDNSSQPVTNDDVNEDMSSNDSIVEETLSVKNDNIDIPPIDEPISDDVDEVIPTPNDNVIDADIVETLIDNIES